MKPGLFNPLSYSKDKSMFFPVTNAVTAQCIHWKNSNTFKGLFLKFRTTGVHNRYPVLLARVFWYARGTLFQIYEKTHKIV